MSEPESLTKRIEAHWKRYLGIVGSLGSAILVWQKVPEALKAVVGIGIIAAATLAAFAIYEFIKSEKVAVAKHRRELKAVEKNANLALTQQWAQAYDQGGAFGFNQAIANEAANYAKRLNARVFVDWADRDDKVVYDTTQERLFVRVSIELNNQSDVPVRPVSVWIGDVTVGWSGQPFMVYSESSDARHVNAHDFRDGRTYLLSKGRCGVHTLLLSVPKKDVLRSTQPERQIAPPYQEKGKIFLKGMLYVKANINGHESEEQGIPIDVEWTGVPFYVTPESGLNEAQFLAPPMHRIDESLLTAEVGASTLTPSAQGAAENESMAEDEIDAAENEAGIQQAIKYLRS
jgi:hypothetical protein